MKIITIVLSDQDEANLERLQRGGDLRALVESLVTRALKEAVRDKPLKPYTCPVCNSHDRGRYIVCQRPDCTDGRDPR